MGDTTDLAAKLKAAALRRVGSKAVMKSEYGNDCFVLVDDLLRSLLAETAFDGDVEVTPDADYDWGEEVEIKDNKNYIQDIQPGYILQFRDHLIEKWVDIEYRDGRTFETQKPGTLRRPHHTAVVVAVNKDGSVTVVEQNVHPNAFKVTQNVIPWLFEGEKNQEIKSKDKTEKTKWKVTGKVWVYRPVPKKKGANLLRPGTPAQADGRRMLASFVPSQGGPKRPQGPIGMEVPTRSGLDSAGAGWPADDSLA